MKRVCIVGVGLIGGSLGLALRRVRLERKRRYHVSGLGRSRAHLAQAKRLGAVDVFSTDAKKVLSQADIVVVCVPVHRVVSVLRRVLPHIRSGAIVTDVGSVKKNVVDHVAQLFSRRKDVFFVGAHPIAGSEKAGVENASADLFQKATCVLTKDRASFQALETIRNLWRSVGARCLLMSAAEHDRALAMTSHLPHLLAFSLFDQIQSASRQNPVLRLLVAGSFRDMTRIAGSDPELWTGVIDNNRAELQKAAASFLRHLKFFSHASLPRLRRHLKRLAHAKATW